MGMWSSNRTGIWTGNEITAEQRRRQAVLVGLALLNSLFFGMLFMFPLGYAGSFFLDWAGQGFPSDYGSGTYFWDVTEDFAFPMAGIVVSGGLLLLVCSGINSLFVRRSGLAPKAFWLLCAGVFVASALLAALLSLLAMFWPR